jgi:hypothetical protein
LRSNNDNRQVDGTGNFPDTGIHFLAEQFPAARIDRKDIHRVAQMDFVKNNVGRMAVTIQGHSDDRHGPGVKQGPEIPDSRPGFLNRDI